MPVRGADMLSHPASLRKAALRGGQGRRYRVRAMNELKRIAFMLAGLLVCALAPPEVSLANGASLTEESERCLECHGRQGQSMSLESGETLNVNVDSEAYASSVHSFLRCSGCHVRFGTDKHPTGSYRSKEAYRLRACRTCWRCHRSEQLQEAAIHSDLLKREREGKAPLCSECHSAHEVKAVARGKVFASEEGYCMGCHGHEMSTEFKDGEKLSLLVETKELHASAHSSLSCSDCHFGFSSESHVRRAFKSRRDYTLAASAICCRCHFDKYSKTMESIHYAMISQGNLKAPTCSDCHGAHGVSYVSDDRVNSARKCRGCHGDIYEIYANSVHGAALFGENNRDVPICVDCHSAHEIRDPLTREYHERIPELCSGCHGDVRVVGKYGLSTDVVKTYLSDFHGVTLSFYRKESGTPYKPARPIAVCTDCHGTHNITRTTGPDATVVKANLVKKCRKCHEGATENFPDIWLSHYVPSLAKAPMVFMVNTAYKIFMPLMVAGLLLQILLHIWRYLVNR